MNARPAATATREKLIAATFDTLRTEGFAAISARTLATRAGVNQALVFYHFGTVAQLVDAACRQASDDSLAFYTERLAAVGSLSELLTVGRALHEREREQGTVAVMAQLMSGAQGDALLAETARYAMQRWNSEIEGVIRRVLAGNPMSELVEPAGLARAVSASFLGLELYDGVDPVGAATALDALEQLGVLIGVVDDLGPVARRALRARLRRRQGVPPRP